MVTFPALATLLAISAPSIIAYSLPPTGGESGLYRGNAITPIPQNDLQLRGTSPPSWDKYNKDTADWTKLGLCRYYIEPSACCDNLVMCQRYCQSNSVSCRAGDYHTDPSIISEEPNPNGERYTRGVCECNVDLQQHLAEMIIEMSQDIDGVICEVWLESVLYAAQILETLTLPASIPIKAFQSLVKLIGYANSVSGLAGFTTLNDKITDICGSDVIDASKLDIAKEAFRMLSTFDVNQLKEA
jgi:hypothetical protein